MITRSGMLLLTLPSDLDAIMLLELRKAMLKELVIITIRLMLGDQEQR